MRKLGELYWVFFLPWFFPFCLCVFFCQSSGVEDITTCKLLQNSDLINFPLQESTQKPPPHEKTD